MQIKKKHDAFFQVLITDLKSARKNTLETIKIQTHIFQKYFLMGRRHCEVKDINLHYLYYSKFAIKQNQLVETFYTELLDLIFVFSLLSYQTRGLANKRVKMVKLNHF